MCCSSCYQWRSCTSLGVPLGVHLGPLLAEPLVSYTLLSGSSPLPPERLLMSQVMVSVCLGYPSTALRILSRMLTPRRCSHAPEPSRSVSPAPSLQAGTLVPHSRGVLVRAHYVRRYGSLLASSLSSLLDVVSGSSALPSPSTATIALTRTLPVYDRDLSAVSSPSVPSVPLSSQ